MPFLSPGDLPKVKVKLLSHVQLCNPMDCSLPDSSVHGTLQARVLEWAAISFSRGIFPSQGSDPSLLCLLRWQVHSLTTEPPGKPVCHSIYKHILCLYKYMPDSLQCLSLSLRYITIWTPLYHFDHSCMWACQLIYCLKCERLTVGRIVKMWSHR